jgi:riboflavin biosynthesis pyrimidine reductase
MSDAWVELLGAAQPEPPADRPWVQVNMVTSIDGRAAYQGRTKGLSSNTDQDLMRELRAHADAVLVGASTLAAEGYGNLVDADRQRARRARGKPALPLAVTVSRTGLLPLGIPLLDDPGQRVLAFVGSPPENPADVPPDLQIESIDAAALPAGILGPLRRDHGVEVLLCEGGPRLLGAMVKAGVVDEMFLTLAHWIVGGDEPRIIEGIPELHPMQGVEVVASVDEEGHTMFRLRFVSRPPRT